MTHAGPAQTLSFAAGDDADELFELLETQLGDVGIDLKYEPREPVADDEDGADADVDDDDLGEDDDEDDDLAEGEEEEVDKDV